MLVVVAPIDFSLCTQASETDDGGFVSSQDQGAALLGCSTFTLECNWTLTVDRALLNQW